MPQNEIICTCYRLDEQDIIQMYTETCEILAGKACRSCLKEVEDIIQKLNIEQEASKTGEK